ncbi:type III pantothenate kinase [Flavilitoribacter nigricans]|uniref:Type III pantothenate kinase n=1 Tax=Flavilitoribacter nigricans (strain ATCC 23147 / DSM 23189 / NBRC 102662 / NCIMB 1420 / SS-2) TaxID=1122177 RepID=A0A2D0N6U7_FLAN2|nr:type III pantothenate kinase [Flavilitoribacter nigricans]PHN03503.1 type III pantothenate kinase [Flavilitoribacter nigricans DSM 23189 = NBRC 102662]
MLLAIDIGNSNVTFGFYHEEKWKHVWRLPTRTDREAPMYYQMQLGQRLLEANITPLNVRRLILSSVVPDLIPIFEHLSQHLLHKKAFTLRPDIYHSLQLQIDRPNEIGTDLLANAAAAYYLYGKDSIVVDFGTALTFTTVNGQGHILGVSIVPGLKTAISALFQKTAQLPEVPLEMPESAVGKNTVHAIQSGVLIGYVGLVRHMLRSIRSELGEHYQAIATGGLSSILHPLRNDFLIINPNLTLDGLRLIGEAIED